MITLRHCAPLSNPGHLSKSMSQTVAELPLLNTGEGVCVWPSPLSDGLGVSRPGVAFNCCCVPAPGPGLATPLALMAVGRNKGLPV